ncbi:WG repeat-containing protein [Salinisphaera sp. Q1T1-3]|uniref:WG repeat-containing protein n=1 Tax=Salinisphaera sp. Q1T1-3 TaxID=2321229 RepID=UPI000E72F51D|nr:WG repeat-containing protein [Salinisphaera sp. Q1T1-3]RJS93597.1 hypothetical protein D3260_07925 [Salinisphaera sp. Q1T1-3]
MTVCFLLPGCDDATTTRQADEQRLIPWRGEDGHFGLARPDGRVLVSPRFVDARPGRHGLAPVAKAEDQWGVADADGQLIVPTRYAAIELLDKASVPLVITKEEYNAWWRISDWRVLPTFNILSTHHSGPWLVTDVPRATWRITNPRTGRTLYSSDRSDVNIGEGHSYWEQRWTPDRHTPHDIRVDGWDDGHLLVDKTLYKVTETHTLLAVARDVVARLADDTFLQRIDGARHRRLRPDGRPVDDVVFTARKRLPVRNINGHTVTLPLPDLFEDDAGRFYVWPDLSRPLPKTLPDYQFPDGQRVTPADLVGHIGFLQPLGNSPWFLLAAQVHRSDAEIPPTLTFFFDADGQWAPEWQPRAGIYTVHDNGKVLFRLNKPYGVLGPNLDFARLPMAKVYPQTPDTRWFLGKDQQGRDGIYDIQARRWVFRKTNVALSRAPVTPDTVAYWRTDSPETHGRARKGLLDMTTGQPVIAPTYETIDDTGRVRLTEDGRKIDFYIDLATGRPFRDTPQQPASSNETSPAAVE